MCFKLQEEGRENPTRGGKVVPPSLLTGDQCKFAALPL